MPEGAADNMARYIATAVGNKSTARVTIVDSNGNNLFSSSDIDGESTGTLSADKAEFIRNEFRNIVITNITKLFTATGYTSVTVSPNLEEQAVFQEQIQMMMILHIIYLQVTVLTHL